MPVPMDVIAFIRSQWKCEDPFCAIDFSQTLWDELCKRAYLDLTERCGHPKASKFCIRLVGQSGSGKNKCLCTDIADVGFGALYSGAFADFVRSHFIIARVRTFCASLFVQRGI